MYLVIFAQKNAQTEPTGFDYALANVVALP